MMKRIISVILTLVAGLLYSQEANQSLKEGNRLYDNKSYDEAEVQYRKSLAAAKDGGERASFNLGDALYKQERYDEAIEQFTKVAQQTENKDLKAKALHNMGNSLARQEKLEEAVRAYKNSLKLNPNDEETRYNLAKSLKTLKQQQQQQQQQNGDSEDNEEKNDQKNNDGEKKPDENDGKDPKEDDKEGNNNNPDKKGGSKEDPNKKPKPVPGQISRGDAERLLEAVNKEEQKLQKELNKQKIKGQPVNTEKDW